MTGQLDAYSQNFLAESWDSFSDQRRIHVANELAQFSGAEATSFDLCRIKFLQLVSVVS